MRGGAPGERTGIAARVHALGYYWRWRRHLRPMRDCYGGEFPWAIRMHDGERLPLRSVTRFSLHYASGNHVAIVSRFQAGSASMTISDLQQRWPSWSRWERIEFGQEASWLSTQSDWADMVRYIDSQGTAEEFDSIATSCGSSLPPEEALAVLTRRLRESAPGKGSNCVGALGHLGHAGALPVLRERLAVLRSHEHYLQPDEFMNWIAYETMWCVEGLRKLGAGDETAACAAELADHPSPGLRESWKRHSRGTR